MEDPKVFQQSIIHSALDIVIEQIKASNQMYLKVVDKYNDWLVSAFVTHSSNKFN